MNTITKRKNLKPTTDENAPISIRDELMTSMPLIVVGTKPLIVHAWSKKALGILRAKHMKEAASPREAKNPEQEFEASKYRSPEGWEGVPAHGLKGAICEGARYVGGSKDMSMTLLKGALYCEPDCPVSNLLRIYSTEPARSREDLVRVGQGLSRTVDIRYRAEYWPWWLRFTIRFPTVLFSAGQIADLIRAAGAFNGFCEWRPGAPISRTGSYGTFLVGNREHEQEFERIFKIKVRS